MKTAEDLLSQEYDSIYKIGNGTFGHIFSVRSKVTGKQYACKIQKTANRKTILVEKQFKILTDLTQTQKFPIVYSLKTLTANSFLIMEKFKKSIDEIFQQKTKKFTIKTIALICYQMFSSLETLHQAGYIHRDLKPQNMMVCTDSHRIKLIDFGLADFSQAKRSSSLIGNVRYASRDAHIGFSSPKDDLQELVYCIYYFFNGRLPWQDCTTEQIEIQIERRIDLNKQPEMTPILQKKHDFLQIFEFPKTKNKIKQIFFQQMNQLARFILNIKNKYEPDYRQIDKKVQRLMAVAGVNKDSCYQWCPQNCKFKINPQNYWSVFYCHFNDKVKIYKIFQTSTGQKQIQKRTRVNY